MSKCPKLKKCSIKSGTSILLKNVCVSVCVHVHSVTKLCPTLWDPMDCSPPGFSAHGDSPGKNIGVGGHALLQGILPTQGAYSDLPRWGGFFTIWATREDGLLEPGNPETVQLEGTISSNIGNVILNFSVPWRFIGLTDFCIFYIFQFSSSCIYLEADTENSFNANLQKRKNKDSEFSLTLFGPQENDLLKAIHLVSDKTLTSTQPF